MSIHEMKPVTICVTARFAILNDIHSLPILFPSGRVCKDAPFDFCHLFIREHLDNPRGSHALQHLNKHQDGLEFESLCFKCEGICRFERVEFWKLAIARGVAQLEDQGGGGIDDGDVVSEDYLVVARAPTREHTFGFHEVHWSSLAIE